MPLLQWQLTVAGRESSAHLSARHFAPALAWQRPASEAKEVAASRRNQSNSAGEGLWHSKFSSVMKLRLRRDTPSKVSHVMRLLLASTNNETLGSRIEAYHVGRCMYLRVIGLWSVKIITADAGARSQYYQCLQRAMADRSSLTKCKHEPHKHQYPLAFMKRGRWP